MRRRSRSLVLVVGLLPIGVGVAVWLIWFPPWASALGKRLVGSWEGRGKVSGEVRIHVREGQGVPAGRTTFSISTTCTVRAEFKPDGTYTWVEKHFGDGMSGEFSLPDKGAEPPRWEVVRADGNKLTVRVHYGEVVFQFDGGTSFTMDLPESAQATGTLVFRRSD
jgi:hypothetical protein